MKKNAAFVGGGVSTVAELGLYSRIIEVDSEYDSFSGANTGAIVAICLAAGESPIDVKHFLLENVYNFSEFIRGREAIKKLTNEFLDNILYKDLPKECICSVTSLKPFFPKFISRKNAKNLTVGQVAAMSSALPGLFFPVMTNPPFNEDPDFKNDVFKFNRFKKPKILLTPWKKRQHEQEMRANKIYCVDTITGTRGTGLDILIAYEEGKKAFDC